MPGWTKAVGAIQGLCVLKVGLLQVCIMHELHVEMASGKQKQWVLLQQRVLLCSS
jgi:hypothetical protein